MTKEPLNNCRASCRAEKRSASAEAAAGGPGIARIQAALSRAPKKQHGFTLLEVLVALTITGMALGGLFTVIAGNKRLAWRAEQALVEATHARNLINFSQLNDSRGNVFVDFQNEELLLSLGGEFEQPERKTQDSPFALRQYEVLDENGEQMAAGSFWVELDFPE